MDVKNLNLNNELLNNSEKTENNNVQHVIIDKSIGDYFLELVFFIVRCLIVCLIPVVAYYFFVLFTGFDPNNLI